MGASTNVRYQVLLAIKNMKEFYKIAATDIRIVSSYE